MKSITEFIKENINESHTKLNIEDVIMAIDNVSYGDDWALNPSASRTGTFADAVNAVKSLYDVLEFHNVFRDLANDLDCDEDTIIDFVHDNEDKIMKEMDLK